MRFVAKFKSVKSFKLKFEKFIIKQKAEVNFCFFCFKLKKINWVVARFLSQVRNDYHKLEVIRKGRNYN